jgi:hypothetical protein
VNSLLSKDFVPLYTALSWILFWSIVLIVARTHLSSAVQALLERVRGGSSLTMGLFKLEGVPKEVSAGSTGVVAVSDTAHPEAIPMGMSEESINAEYRSLVDQQYFLLHAAEVISKRGHRRKTASSSKVLVRRAPLELPNVVNVVTVTYDIYKPTTFTVLRVDT